MRRFFYIIGKSEEVFDMTDQTRIFSTNLNRYLNESHKTQIEVANAIGVSQQTFNTWSRGIALPRMDKIQKLADYFGIGKNDLIDEPKKDYNVVISPSESGDPIIVEVKRISEDMSTDSKIQLLKYARFLKESERGGD